MIHPRTPPAGTKGFDLKPPPSLASDFGPASFDNALSFLDAQAPEVAQRVREAEISERSRKAVARFLTALLESPERFALVREKPDLLRRALEVVGESEYLGDLLIRHPEDMVVLESSPLPSAAAQMEFPLDPSEDAGPHAWASNPALAMRQKMAVLRRHFLARVLELGAADLFAFESSFAVLKRWSAVACALRDQRLARLPVRSRNARASRTARHPCPFAVLALGRLALNEFDLASDADLIFVTGPEVGRDDLDFWKRLAAKMIEVLSSYTREGTVFAVDSRLRPRGQEGELVVTQEELLSYVRRTRPGVGGVNLPQSLPRGRAMRSWDASNRFSTGEAIFDRFAAYPSLAAELRQMRRRLEERGRCPAHQHEDRAGRVLRYRLCRVSPPLAGTRRPSNQGANMAEQIGRVASAGLMDEEDSEMLSEGANFLRSVDHAVRLVTGRSAEGLPERAGHAEAVENLARRWGLIAGSETLAANLLETRRRVREVYCKLVEAA